IRRISTVLPRQAQRTTADSTAPVGLCGPQCLLLRLRETEGRGGRRQFNDQYLRRWRQFIPGGVRSPPKTH
ncbi:unnamed protein product, partial [Cyprideis torosa]